MGGNMIARFPARGRAVVSPEPARTTVRRRPPLRVTPPAPGTGRLAASPRADDASHPQPVVPMRGACTAGAPSSSRMSLQGKVAIVTGGNSGIGKAIALALAALGADIVIDYIVDPEAEAALESQ